MKRVVSLGGRTASLVILAVVCCSCLKQLRPDQAMSDRSIAGETKVKALLDRLDPKLAGPAVEAPAVTTTATQGEALAVGLQEAVLMGLEQNASFQVERLKPAISRSAEEVARAAFDPVLSGQVTSSHGPDLATGTTATSHATVKGQTVSGDADATTGGVGLRQATSLGGTVELRADEERLQANDALETTLRQRNWDLTITQSLLRGRGPEVSLARLRQSRLDTEISLYELQGAAEALVSQVEGGYWDVVLASRALDIYRQSLAIAKQQVEEVEERIRVGALAESEAAAAQAEAASRNQQLVAAQGTYAKARLNLLRLVNPTGHDWQAELTTKEAPELPEFTLDTVESHVALALNKRPDLNQARLQVRRRDLDVVQTKNGLLPKLDLFVSLGGSRYTTSVAGQEDMTANDKAYAGGLTLAVPLGNRAAKAQHQAASWSLDQANAALANMEQLVQVDVRSAYVDVEQAQAQVKAAEATCRLRQKTYDLEQEKFRVGRSTTLLVAQAQRDLLASQITQAEAVVAVRKAMVALYRLEGSLLAHRGISP